MILSNPLSAGHFRFTSLNIEGDDARATLAKCILSINFDLVQRELEITFWQTDDPLCLEAVWDILENDKNIFQVDGYNSRDQSIFSIIFLDCEASNHEFTFSMKDLADEQATHRFLFKYREHVRFGPNGALPKKGKTSDKDKIHAKLLFQNPSHRL